MPTAKATSQEAKEIRLPDLIQSRMRVEIVGTTPLLMNRFAPEMVEEAFPEPGAEPLVPGVRRTADQDVAIKRYRLPNGRDAFPSSGLKKAMVAAGYRFADEKGTELRGAFSIDTDLLEIDGPYPRTADDPPYPARQNDWGKPNGKTTVPIYRPRYMPWRIRVPISYIEPFIDDRTILNLVRLAGIGVGIGAFRPERNGTNGQFHIGEVEVIRTKEQGE